MRRDTPRRSTPDQCAPPRSACVHRGSTASGLPAIPQLRTLFDERTRVQGTYQPFWCRRCAQGRQYVAHVALFRGVAPVTRVAMVLADASPSIPRALRGLRPWACGLQIRSEKCASRVPAERSVLVRERQSWRCCDTKYAPGIHGGTKAREMGDLHISTHTRGDSYVSDDWQTGLVQVGLDHGGGIGSGSAAGAGCTEDHIQGGLEHLCRLDALGLRSAERHPQEVG